MRLTDGLCQDPLGSYSAPSNPVAVLKGRGGRGKERVGNRKGEEGKGREGREGVGRGRGRGRECRERGWRARLVQGS